MINLSLTLLSFAEYLSETGREYGIAEPGAEFLSILLKYLTAYLKYFSTFE